mmetsp:Transcript_149740/g.480858  ORF Transcript_149740/g.480858 Transcript_149740/m.480858 type:complete len:449 (-) Transcript_149740:54-1400(-)
MAAFSMTFDRLFGGDGLVTAGSPRAASPIFTRASPRSDTETVRGRRCSPSRHGGGVAACLSPRSGPADFFELSPPQLPLQPVLPQTLQPSVQQVEPLLALNRRGAQPGVSPNVLSSPSFPLQSPSSRTRNLMSPSIAGSAYSGSASDTTLGENNRRGQRPGGSPTMQSSVLGSASPQSSKRQIIAPHTPGTSWEIDAHPGAIRCFPDKGATSPTLRSASPGARGREDDIEGFVGGNSAQPSWFGVAFGRRRAAPPSGVRSSASFGTLPSEDKPQHEQLAFCPSARGGTFGALQGARQRKHIQAPSTQEVLLGGAAPVGSPGPASRSPRVSDAKPSLPPWGVASDSSSTNAGSAALSEFESVERKVPKDEYAAATSPSRLPPSPKSPDVGDVEARLQKAIRSSTAPGMGGAPRRVLDLSASTTSSRARSPLRPHAPASPVASPSKGWRI